PLEKIAKTPSPSDFTTRPPWDSHTPPIHWVSRVTVSVARAFPMASKTLVLPVKSANTTVEFAPMLCAVFGSSRCSIMAKQRENTASEAQIVQDDRKAVAFSFRDSGYSTFHFEK